MLQQGDSRETGLDGSPVKKQEGRGEEWLETDGSKRPSAPALLLPSGCHAPASFWVSECCGRLSCSQPAAFADDLTDLSEAIWGVCRQIAVVP